MYSTPEPSPPSSSGGDANTRNARYAYLVGRLRSRQITMEEATELFNLMQATLSRTEAGRLAALAQASASRSAIPSRAIALPPPPASGGGGSDDFLLLGLLAMGAGVGLLAAMTKRMQELTPSPAPTARTDQPASSR
ncbi:MAG TPA: hypothetical protein VK424_08835 [Thermoplasmata archaeon]|nr:hypothetical protein [Thermoplasmata archaeon]